MGFEPVFFVWPRLRLAWIERLSSYRSVSLSRWFSRIVIASWRWELGVPRWVGCAIGLDVRREFCEVAVCEDGQVRLAGRVPATLEGVRSLAGSLLASDRVVLEVTGGCWEVTRILEPQVDRVVVVSPDERGIASARAKTDRLDA